MIRPPLKLHNASQQQQLRVYWHDGNEHTLGYRQLRTACRCTSCRARISAGDILLVHEDLTLEKINNLGQGLQFVFSDGHERGIYPWQYLFELGEAIKE